MLPELNVHQVFGAIFLLAGFCATLCGFGVLSPPANTPESRTVHYLWMGPVAMVIGLLEIIGTR
jgi:hypothetical protein